MKPTLLLVPVVLVPVVLSLVTFHWLGGWYASGALFAAFCICGVVFRSLSRPAPSRLYRLPERLEKLNSTRL